MSSPNPSTLPGQHVPSLPPNVWVLERGWLSANSTVLIGPEGTALVDSGYCSHAAQTVALVHQTLQGRPLDRLLNTHLHSDHCGGNAELQRCHPSVQTWIPPGEADAVRAWDEDRLSYRATGQRCPRFRVDGLLRPGTTTVLAGRAWQVLAAPGHDPHAVLLFDATHGVLISGDALWDNGFGVVFPEIEGESAFDAVADTLDLIDALDVRIVIPGHGPVFGGTRARVDEALARARSRLTQFRDRPAQHTLYAAKVLLKFRLMDWGRLPMADLLAWCEATPYMGALNRASRPSDPLESWVAELLAALARSGSLHMADGWVEDR